MYSYLFQKAGIFYYQRLVPMDLQSHYRRKMLSFSLRTRSHKQALRKAVEYSAKLEAQWTAFRALYNDPFSGFLRPLRNVLVFGFSRLGRHCLVRCAASGRMSGVFWVRQLCVLWGLF